MPRAVFDNIARPPGEQEDRGGRLTRSRRVPRCLLRRPARTRWRERTTPIRPGDGRYRRARNAERRPTRL